jgi:hypothetical protein
MEYLITPEKALGAVVWADYWALGQDKCVREEARVEHGAKGVQRLAHGGRHWGNPGGNWPDCQRPIKVMGF